MISFNCSIKFGKNYKNISKQICRIKTISVINTYEGWHRIGFSSKNKLQ